jgi:hypothetical protein
MIQGINQFVKNANFTKLGCPQHYKLIGYIGDKCDGYDKTCESCWILSLSRSYNEDGSLEKVGDVED